MGDSVRGVAMAVVDSIARLHSLSLSDLPTSAQHFTCAWPDGAGTGIVRLWRNRDFSIEVCAEDPKTDQLRIVVRKDEAFGKAGHSALYEDLVKALRARFGTSLAVGVHS